MRGYNKKTFFHKLRKLTNGGKDNRPVLEITLADLLNSSDKLVRDNAISIYKHIIKNVRNVRE